MHIGFDISQTGTAKAGFGYIAHAMIQAMLNIAPAHRYSLFPDFGDFYFDALMPDLNPYPGQSVHYGPKHGSVERARDFWTGPSAEASLGIPDIVHANNFWCPVQFASSRLVYTFYDMGFVVEPAWTTDANRVGCFNGVFRSAVAADWVVAISEASRTHYLSVLSVLEGMQFGAPTLASNSTSIPEVAGDAALLLAPEDTAAWTQAMLRLGKNRSERDSMVSKSLKQAARFDWKHSASQLLQLYEEALAAPKRQQA